MEIKGFNLPELERAYNPFSHKGVKALAIVLAAVVFISAVVYVGLVRQRKESPPVLPAQTTQEETIRRPEPTDAPAAEPTRKPSPTPMAEKAPAATESSSTGVSPTEIPDESE
ncbi:hypothetical protein KKB40_04485 [Patescibacteria group bacterium]|nr:hypothetical protein [Patescibacteria group bacterium]